MVDFGRILTYSVEDQCWLTPNLIGLIR